MKNHTMNADPADAHARALSRTRHPAALTGFVVLLLTFAASIAIGQELPLSVAELDRSDPVDFAKEIMPVLKRNCLACHHQKEAEGGLVLETLADLLKGGDSGPGVVPKDLSASVIFARATGSEEPLMPPEDNEVGAHPLTDMELGLLKLWIEQGATGTDGHSGAPLEFQAIPESMRTVYAIDTSPDGQRLAVSRGNRVALYDTENYAETVQLVDDSLGLGKVADVDLVQSLAFAPDGKRIATGGFRTIRIWHQVRSPFDPTSSPLSTAAGLIALNRDGTHAAMVNAIGDIEIWNLADQTKLHTVSGHSGRVTGLVWASASERVWSCDQNGRLIHWNPSNGEKLGEFETEASLSGLAVSSDGLNVAAIDEERKLRLWHLRAENQWESNSSPLVEITGVTAIAFADQPSASLIVAIEKEDGTAGVNLYGMADNQLIRTIEHGAVVDALAVSSDQTQLLTGGRDGQIKVWNMADGTAIRTMQGDERSAMQVALATRNAARQKAELDRMNQLTQALEERLKKENEALEKVNGEQQKSVEALAAQEQARVDAVALVMATEAKIATAVADAKAAEEAIAAAQKQLADAVALKETAAKELEEQKKAVAAAETTKQNTETVIQNRKQTIESAEAAKQLAEQAIPEHQLIVARESRRLKQLEQLQEVQQRRLREPSQAVVSIAIRADGSQVAAAQNDGDLIIYRASDGLAIDHFATTVSLNPPAVTFAGNLLVGFGQNQPASVWSQHKQWVLERTIGSVDDPTTLSDRVTAMDFRPDGMSIAAGSGPPSRSGEVKIFAIDTGAMVRDYGPIHSDTVLGLSFSPDGSQLASAAADKTIRLLDVAEGTEIRSMEGHSHHVLGVDWQDDGRTLASAGADQTIKIWNVETGQQHRTIAGFRKEITAVAFLATTNQLASACASGQVRISNSADGKTIKDLDSAGDFLYCVAVSADGNRVLAGGHSGTVRIWNLADGKLVAELK